jgi:predicted  nucleic acid-binding Zn-ribbon protein
VEEPQTGFEIPASFNLTGGRSMEENDLEILNALADLDDRKRDLDVLAATLPEQLAGREAELAEAREELEKTRRRLEEAQRERRRLEGAIEDKTQALAKYRSQLDSVKTNKEYQSLQHEIATTRESISKTEDRLLELLDSTERDQSGVDEREGALQRLEADVSAANREAEERLRDVEVQLIEVAEKRKRLIPRLSQPVQAEYGRLCERYPGGAFAVATGGVCQGCFVNVPAQIVAELRTGNRLYRCESCGRFIIKVIDE